MIKFVTSNEHKFQEIGRKLTLSGISIEWVKMAYEEIQADNTSDISMDSAEKLSREIHEPFFLEDTGLYIDSLNGFPGPYSSFVSRTIGNEGILKLLKGADRVARFITVITYWDGEGFHQFTGTLEGEISLEIKGSGGFGFDPIFIPSGQAKTLSDMSLDEKNSISHRSRALERFVSFLPRK